MYILRLFAGKVRLDSWLGKLSTPRHYFGFRRLGLGFGWARLDWTFGLESYQHLGIRFGIWLGKVWLGFLAVLIKRA